MFFPEKRKINQPISDELGVWPLVSFLISEISRNVFTAYIWGQKVAPNISLKTHLPPLIGHNLD